MAHDCTHTGKVVRDTGNASKQSETQAKQSPEEKKWTLRADMNDAVQDIFVTRCDVEWYVV